MLNGAENLKSLLKKIERKLREPLEWLKWLNKETPLLFLIIMWSILFIVTIPIAMMAYCGIISHEDFNIWLSIAALLTTMILSIVVVL